MCIEEMAELAKAIIKVRRIKPTDTDVVKQTRLVEMLEEVVDVELMVEQMKYILVELSRLDAEYKQIMDRKLSYIKLKLGEVDAV